MDFPYLSTEPATPVEIIVMPCPICGHKPMNCNCTALEREQHERLEQLKAIMGVVGGETLGDTLIRLGDLLQAVAIDDQGADVDDWKCWLVDVGTRLNNVEA